MAADFVSLADLLRPPHERANGTVFPPDAQKDVPPPTDLEPDAVPRMTGSGAVTAFHSGAGTDYGSDVGAAPGSKTAATLDPGAELTSSGHAGDSSDEVASNDGTAALRDARLFRARLANAFDEAAARLVRELSAHVLARELRLAPCEIGALVARVAASAPVVRVRVAPEDVARIHDVPVLADRELSAGDAILELAGGALDARLGVRLATVLEAFV